MDGWTDGWIDGGGEKDRVGGRKKEQTGARGMLRRQTHRLLVRGDEIEFRINASGGKLLSIHQKIILPLLHINSPGGKCIENKSSHL